MFKVGPSKCGPALTTVQKRHDRRAADGPGTGCWPEASANADAAGGLDWLVSVDSSINRAHQHAAGARRALVADPRHGAATK